MDWQLILPLIIIVGGLITLMLAGLPVALCFLLVSAGGAIVYWGYDSGLTLFMHNIRESVSSFIFLPLIMFILLGNVMFESGMGIRMLDVLNKWLGRLPGRLGVLAVAFCTLFATMSGSQLAAASMLGQVLTPQMEERGYKKPISIGAVMGSGGLAMIIPPSNQAILLAAIAGISVAKLLIAGILPGLVLASLYASYIILRCWIQPSISPSYEVTRTPLSEKLIATVRYVLPLGLFIFSVLGLIFIGWATPTESAVLGAIASLILAAGYRRFNWKMLKTSVMRTIRTAASVLIIISAARTFTQILAFSGVSGGIGELAAGLALPPIMLILAMMLTLIMLGTFMTPIAMIMITMPIFIPIVLSLGFNEVWFGLIVLITMEMSMTTPPVGLMLFVMKGVAPPDTTMADIYKAGIPFLVCDFILILLVLLFPIIALWLPGMI